jgi:putative chitinase
MLLGRASYRRFAAALAVDLEGDPDLAATLSLGFRIAGVYWTSIKANDFADHGDLPEITRGLAGDLISLADRLALYAKAKKALGIE